MTHEFHKATKKEVELIHSREYNAWICYDDVFDLLTLLWFTIKVMENAKHIKFENENFEWFFSQPTSEYSSEPWKLYFDRSGEFDKAWKCRYQFSIPENHYSVDFLCNLLSYNKYSVDFIENPKDSNLPYVPILVNYINE